MSEGLLCELVGVSAHYSRRGVGRPVIQNIDLQLRERESISLVGESGSGKTTLGKVLLGLLKLTNGSYKYRGRPVSELKGADARAWRINTQAVFQNPFLALSPRCTIATLLTEPLEQFEPLNRRDRILRAGDLLERVGLPAEIANRYPVQLSGGQRQRIAIARAISTSPEIIVLDEPLSALDVSVRARIVELLRELRSGSTTTFVYITHDLATVPHLSQHTYVLKDGQIVESLPSNRLDTATHPYTRTLIESVPSL